MFTTRPDRRRKGSKQPNAVPQFPDNPYSEAIAGLNNRPASPTQDEGLRPSKPAFAGAPSLHRPPAPPGALLGPYLQFVTTTPQHTWLGDMLVLHRDRDQPAPTLSFSCPVQQHVDVLYEELFGMQALRFNLELDVEDGVGDQRVEWTLTWKGQQQKQGAWHVPRRQQKWRGGSHSCNGFDETVPEGTIADLGFNDVWRHLNSVHEDTPLHFLIYGGDQIYVDFIFEDVPFLHRWLKMDWTNRWTHEFSEANSRICAEYWFRAYAETWEREEVRQALESIPALQQWDDHDIFDGAGSYPPELHDSPVMLGLMRTAQKFRLLFQHHTTPTLAQKHSLFGHAGFNWVCQMGPRMACLGIDGRTERNHSQVMDPESWVQIFDRLKALPETTQHLVILFPVPFSFIRLKAVENVFAFLANSAPWVRRLPGIKSTNSIFGLPEFYDDLLDEWCHDSHIDERNDILEHLQTLAASKEMRITMLSGDVHCCGLSRFRSDAATRRNGKLKPETDFRLMYNVISSAIVNQAPSKNACIGYHYVQNSWKPIYGTEEELVPMFERRPEGGSQVRHRKVMPNRNWCYVEEVGAQGSLGDSQVPAQTLRSQPSSASSSSGVSQGTPEHEHHTRLTGELHDWYKSNYTFDKKRGYPSTLGPVSSPEGLGQASTPLHRHRHGPFCHHRKSKNLDTEKLKDDTKANTQEDPDGEIGDNGLRIRLWLESRRKEEAGRQFSSYEVVVPPLRVAAPPKALKDGSQSNGDAA